MPAAGYLINRRLRSEEDETRPDFKSCETGGPPVVLGDRPRGTVTRRGRTITPPRLARRVNSTSSRVRRYPSRDDDALTHRKLHSR